MNQLSFKPENTKAKLLMKNHFLPMLAASVLSITGCAGTTEINNLALPPATVIAGTVTQVDGNGFTLKDDSGSIFVKAMPSDNKTLGVLPGEKVKVYGNLLGGQERAFDGYVVRKASGEQIIVQNPTPHFGFIIQSKFE